MVSVCIKIDLALNILRRLKCYKTQTTNQPTNHNLEIKGLIPFLMLLVQKWMKLQDWGFELAY